MWPQLWQNWVVKLSFSSTAKQYTTSKLIFNVIVLKLMDLYAKLNMQYFVTQIWTFQ